MGKCGSSEFNKVYHSMVEGNHLEIPLIPTKGFNLDIKRSGTLAGVLQRQGEGKAIS